MSETTSTLIEAWQQRLNAAANALAHAEQAPALVTPQHLEKLRADLAHAKRQCRFWMEAR